MIKITPEFKQAVVKELARQREIFDGNDEAFAKQHDINPAVYNQIKNGKPTDKLLADPKWLALGSRYDVSLSDEKWKIVRTEVLNQIEEDIIFCQEFSASKICVDETSIGKSETAKQCARSLKNCFHVDASQAKTKQAFIRLIAKKIGVDTNGKYVEMKNLLKYYLRNLPNPIIIIDEAGDLEYTAFLELKELWNATEGSCGWYMIGADGLREKISRGIKARKVGYREIFARYNEKYTTPVPVNSQEKTSFYRKLLTDVVGANCKDKTIVNDIVRRCLLPDENGNISGLRRAKTLTQIYLRNANKTA